MIPPRGRQADLGHRSKQRTVDEPIDQVDSRIQNTGIKLAIGIELDQHPEQHGRTITVADAVVVFPISHHRSELILSLADKFIAPFLHESPPRNPAQTLTSLLFEILFSDVKRFIHTGFIIFQNENF